MPRHLIHLISAKCRRISYDRLNIPKRPAERYESVMCFGQNVGFLNWQDIEDFGVTTRLVWKPFSNEWFSNAGWNPASSTREAVSNTHVPYPIGNCYSMETVNRRTLRSERGTHLMQRIANLKIGEESNHWKPFSWTAGYFSWQEHAHNLWVEGSSPSPATIFKPKLQLVEATQKPT